MDPIAALVAAKLSGKLPVVVAIGRMDYGGRFQPFGQSDFIATVSQNQDQMWVAAVNHAAVTYSHPSPRIITHVGMFIHDQWYLDELDITRHLKLGDVVTFDLCYPLPEFHDGIPNSSSRLPYSRD